MNYEWPGNIRQLENAMEFAVINTETDLIGVEDLPQELILADASKGVAVPKLYDAVNEATRRIILEALTSTNGNVTEAAEILGIHANNLHRLIARHRLREELDELRRNRGSH